MGGLWSILGFLRMLGRRKDLTIISPKDCSEVRTVVHDFLGIYGKTMPYKVILREVMDGEEVNVGSMSIQAFQVIHRGSIRHAGILEPIPAVGYSIRYGNQRVVISGDTGYCKRLVEFAEGANLAVIEATSSSGIPEVHLSIDEAVEIGKKAKKYILIHKRD
jgi:ribonuclease BN (tRNA processing enzyme)